MRKSLSILIIIFLFTFILRLTSITYGYYSAKILTNNGKESLSITSKLLKIQYEDGTSIMNFKGDYIFPGDSAEKLWTIKNTGTDDVSYNILIDNVSNDFERIQDLRFTLFINDEEVSTGAINNNLKQYLYTNKIISASQIDTIKLVFEYAETEEIQNMDMNKTISFKVNVDTNNVKVSEGTNNVSILANNHINNYRIYGNSIQDGVPSKDNYVPIQSVGDLVTDESSDYYGKYQIPITVSGKNKFNYIKGEVSCGTIIEELSNGSIVKGDESDATNMNVNSKGWYLPGWSKNSSPGIVLHEGDVVTVSADITALEFNPKTSKEIYIHIYVRGKSSGLLGKGTLLTLNEKTRVSQKFTIPSAYDGNLFFPIFTLSSNTYKIENIQIEYGDSATEYEPYVEPITTNIYLDEPLRAYKNHKDYIDFKQQMVIRQIGSDIVTSNEIIGKNDWYYNQGWNAYSTYVPFYPLLETYSTNGLSNYYISSSDIYSTSLGTNYIFQAFNNSESRVYFVTTPASGETADDFKLWLDSKELLGQPLEYILRRETELKIPIKLPVINTISGTNIIEVGTTTIPLSSEFEILD